MTRPLPRDLPGKTGPASRRRPRTGRRSPLRHPVPLALSAVVGTCAVLVLLLGPVAWWATASVGELKGKEKADAVNSTRQVLLAAAGGAAALVGIGFTARTYYLSRRGQLTDRYGKAVAQLASDKLTERVGGVYALEHLMVESERDHVTVVEVLAAFIRERTTTGETGMHEERHNCRHDGSKPAFRSLATDVQVALTVLGRRPRRPERNPVDLRTADLCGADLSGLRLDHANLWGAKLKYTVAHEVDLRHANLSFAELVDTRLGRARLRGAHLGRAVLDHATLDHADLREAELGGAGLRNCDLTGADLGGARLGGADLSGAKLSGANVTGTDLATPRGERASPGETAVDGSRRGGE
ncbi:pentapeptide repeat-containing protein [Saccharothrix syringae]|nr:pentapeptide repeat-containing protein [Saccharothrix syringae]